MRRTEWCIAAGLVLAITGMAGAATYDYTVYPWDLADGPTFLNGRGNVPFGYDPDQPPPLGVLGTGAPGYGDSCFGAAVQGSAAGGPVDYTAIRLSPRDIFGVADVTISDLAAMSYYTKWTSGLDWQIKVYTEDETATKWYKTRFNWTRPSPADSNWNQYTADGLTVNDIYDKLAGTYVSVPGSGLLTDLDALYGTEKILFIDVIAGYMTNSPAAYTCLDGIEMTLDSGDVAKLNLAVPEPVTMFGVFAGVAGLGGYLRRRLS